MDIENRINQILESKILSYRPMLPVKVLLIVLALVVGVMCAVPYCFFRYFLPNMIEHLLDTK